MNAKKAKQLRAQAGFHPADERKYRIIKHKTVFGSGEQVVSTGKRKMYQAAKQALAC